MRNLVFGLSPRDPMTLLFAVAVLAAVGVMAASLPALRAARVDPAPWNRRHLVGDLDASVPDREPATRSFG